MEYVRTLGISELGSDKYPVIQFLATDGKVIRFYGPENFDYPVGTILRIVYNPAQPTECIVFSFGAIYTGSKAIIPGVLFLLWVAFYLAFRTKK